MRPVALANCYLPGVSLSATDTYSLVWDDDGRLAGISHGRACHGFDCRGSAVIPVVVDPHLHGIGGHDVMRVLDLGALAADLGKRGLGAFCASAVAVPLATLRQWLEAVSSRLCDSAAQEDAICLGAHIEGTFISREYAGAHDPHNIFGPKLEVLREVMTYGGSDSIAMVTVSPHGDDAEAFVAGATEAGIRVALGHTNASPGALARAVAAGATCITHLFNAMPPITARSPGLLGLAMEHDLYAEVIPNPDLVSTMNVSLAVKALGDDRVIAISDALASSTFSDASLAPSGMSFRSGDRIMGGAVPLPGLLRHLRGALGGSVESLVKISSQNALRFFGRRPTWPPKVGDRSRVLLLDQDWNVVPIPKPTWTHAGGSG